MSADQIYRSNICLEANRHYISHPHCPVTLKRELARENQSIRRAIREA